MGRIRAERMPDPGNSVFLLIIANLHTNRLFGLFIISVADPYRKNADADPENLNAVADPDADSCSY